MKKFLLTTALVAVTALSMAACDNADDTAKTEPASGEASMTVAPVTDVTPVAPSDTGATMPSEPTVTPDNASSAQGIAVGEPNPATPDTIACDFSDLVGKNISEVDQASYGRPIRVLYPDSPATMDFNAERINIILEKGTDKVTEVRCG